MMPVVAPDRADRASVCIRAQGALSPGNGPFWAILAGETVVMRDHIEAIFQDVS